MNDRKQSKPLLDENGKFAKGNTPPAGFNKHPENRHNGAWKKEDTPRFKLEQMMKLSEPDLRKVAEDKDAPLFERKLATAIAKGQWREIKEMIQEVYGNSRVQRIRSLDCLPLKSNARATLWDFKLPLPP